MARAERTSAHTRTWSVPTSPRSPEKLVDVVGLLPAFEGRLWNEAAQQEYAQLLAAENSYEGRVHQGEPAFAARDRVNRGPQMFGLVELRRGRPLHITDAGRALLNGGVLDDLFLRQLLKWQYSSPIHGGQEYTAFRIRPFLEMVRLVRDLDGLSKVEIAIFGVPLIDWRAYDTTVDRLRVFRAEYQAQQGTVARRTVVRRWLQDAVSAAHAADIRGGLIGKRERARPGQDRLHIFLVTKAGNWLDYADAAVRYFRATGVFTLSGRFTRLTILDERREEVNQLLQDFPREPVRFDTDDEYYAWLGNPNLPVLPSDNLEVLHRQVETLFNTLSPADQREHAAVVRDAAGAGSIYQLRVAYQGLSALSTQLAIRDTQVALAGVDRIDEILDLYQRIRGGDPDIVDRATFLEWNTWRAMAMLDDGVITPRFKVDQQGQPLGPAPGKGADIECSYTTHLLAVEVTMTGGARQHAMEGEPVERHVGLLQQAARDRGDKREVYGLFLAPTLAPTVVAYFWGLHNMRRPTFEFRGHINIVPLTLDEFQAFLTQARGRFPVRAAALHGFLAEASRLARESETEVAWREAVTTRIQGWVDAA